MIQMCVVLIGISFLTFLLTYLAPGDPGLYLCLELVLDKTKAPGKPGRKFQVPVVHRFDLHGDVPAAQRFLTAPEPCHTLYHCSTSVLPADAGLPSVFSQSYPIIIASDNDFVNSQSRKFR